MDEIVFDDLTCREPKRLRRPDADPLLACLAFRVPAADDLPIFLDHRAAIAVERHTLSDTTVELGGVLLGHEAVDDRTGAPFVWIVRSLEARHYANTEASFTYTHDSWAEIRQARERSFPDLDIVGWYHTHPDFGIFLSGHDQFLHRHFFGQPLQVAYVVDPIRGERGFFYRRADELARVGGFHLVGSKGERQALARSANDLEGIANVETSGVLSPLLEAKLIAMLSRPPSADPSGPGRQVVQLASALAVLFGLLTGTLLIAAVAWIRLGGIDLKLADQANALAAIRADVASTASAQRLAMDALAATSGPEVAARYERAARERDVARAKLSDQRAAGDALAEQYARVRDELNNLRGASVAASKRIVALEGEADSLRAQVQEAGGDQKQPVADPPGGIWRSLILPYGGWVMTAILGVALVLARSQPTSPAPPIGDSQP